MLIVMYLCVFNVCVCVLYIAFMFLFACMVSFLSCYLLLYVYTGPLVDQPLAEGTFPV